MEAIAAIVSPVGAGAVSIIRLSGEESWAIAEKLTNKNFEANKFKLAWLGDKDIKVDQVLVLPFKAPNSFTGEDVIEFHCHGGLWVTQRVLDLVLDAGARLAKAGEFSQRAFLNQKLDLSQAEAIMDMVSAKTNLSTENAVNLYQGFLGKEILEIRSNLMHLLGEVTAGLDFPDEVGDFDKTKFDETIKNSLRKIDELLASEKEGHILRHGFKVALVGDPNAGKSSLMNTLLKNERAIVTEIAGTTRDTIEESYNLKGLPVVLVDTAGMRETEDKVEKIGVERSKAAIKDADLVIFLQDLSQMESLNGAGENKEALAKHLSARFDINLNAKSYVLVGTKKDLCDRLLRSARNDALSSSNDVIASQGRSDQYDLEISSLENQNINKLEELIYKKALENHSESQIKINERQADLLRQAKTALEKALQASADNMPQDFWTIDLKSSIHALGEITGAVVTEELLDNIFASFCIGK